MGPKESKEKNQSRPNLRSTDKLTDPPTETESADTQIADWVNKWIAEMERALAANQKQRLAEIEEKFSKEVARLEETLTDI